MPALLRPATRKTGSAVPALVDLPFRIREARGGISLNVTAAMFSVPATVPSKEGDASGLACCGNNIAATGHLLHRSAVPAKLDRPPDTGSADKVQAKQNEPSNVLSTCYRPLKGGGRIRASMRR